MEIRQIPGMGVLLSRLRQPRSLGAVSALAYGLAFSSTAMAQQHTIYLGTYTGPQSQGIYRTILDDQTGQLGAPELVAATDNPSFIALSPNRRFLYAVGEKAGSVVSAWGIGEDGKFTALNQQPTQGDWACHIGLDAAGKTVLVANYGTGNVSSFPINEDGSLGALGSEIKHTGSGPNQQRQQSPHAHSIYADPSGPFVYTCDLGTDEIGIYRLDASKGVLTPNDPPVAKVTPGDGPRHLAIHPAGFVYVNTEMGLNVTVFKRDTNGALNPIQTVPTLTPGAPTEGVSTAEIFVHPSGKWLYVSNRGRDTISSYAIDQQSGQLIWLEETPTPREPRGFGLSDDGQWLVVGGQRDNSVAAFKVDTATGKLSPSGQAVQVGAPVCVVFVPKVQPQ